MSFLSRKPARPGGRGRDDAYDDYDGYAHDTYQNEDDGWSPGEYFSPEGIKGRWAGEHPDGRAGGRGQRDGSLDDDSRGNDFNGAEYGGSTGVVVNSATQITATSPAGTGTVDVTVTTPGGTSATSTADQFSYVAAPTVTAVSPTSGPAAGGTSVTITGTNFTGATAVKFGATTATFTVTNATSISATSPAGSCGRSPPWCGRSSRCSDT